MADCHVLPPYSLRMTAELRDQGSGIRDQGSGIRDQLEGSAGQARRSLNAEIVARLEEGFAKDAGEQPLSEHDAAMQVLPQMYQKTLDNISELKTQSSLTTMKQVELLHEEATAKYLRQAAARPAMPLGDRPARIKKGFSMPIGIDTKVHLATLVAETTPPPKTKE